MFMETAKELCPNLIVLPYDFTAIEEVSCQLYKIFFRFTPAVQAMSCDEAYLELPKGSCGVEVAKEIRKAIYETTKCNASVGVSYNILLARLATKHAKPNNAFEITSSNVDDLLKDLYVRDLPGVGRVLQSKLAEFGIEVCSDLLKWPESDLCAQVGAKTGKMLLRFSRGVDSRPLEIASAAKSVSAEVNYGVRLSSNDEAIEFIEALAKEVHCRLKATGCLAGAIALKLKIRHPDAPLEPTKFMGHGWTNDTSKSIRFNAPTDSLDHIVSTSANIWKQLQVVPQELRGAGIQLSRLCHTYTHINSGPALPSIFAQAPKKAGTYDRSDILPPKPVNIAKSKRSAHPTLSQIDPDVLVNLPEAIQREILHDIAKPTIPTSYSQIDQDVLRSLPKPMRQEIQQQYPKKVHFRPSVQNKTKIPLKNFSKPPLKEQGPLYPKRTI
ncbi:hypothetical protein Ae201684P_004918 [Aphanomyces euteiches]|nr:hypothetical protein Ae201684P_004918 [Aphanomyces euteiches]